MSDDDAAGDDDWNAEDPDSNFGPKDAAAAIVPKVAAALSLLGSSALIAEIAADKRSGGRSKALPATKVTLLAMSVADLFFSFGWFLTTWPSPVGTPWAWAAKGNTATCDAQGFVLLFGWVASPLFNIILAWFYLLVVKYEWTERRIRRILPWTQGAVWSLALIISASFLAAGMINSDAMICWIDSHPFGCQDSLRYGDEATCTRGDNAWVYAIIFGTVFPGGLCIVAAVVLMGMMFRTVRKIENKQSRWSNRSPNVASRPSPTVPGRSSARRSKAILHQAMWYVGSFMICYIPDMIAVILWSGFEIWNYWIDYVAYFFLPLQGFLNFVVFARKRSNMKTCIGKALKMTVFCCNLCRKKKSPNVSTTTSMFARMSDIWSGQKSRVLSLYKSQASEAEQRPPRKSCSGPHSDSDSAIDLDEYAQDPESADDEPETSGNDEAKADADGKKAEGKQETARV